MLSAGCRLRFLQGKELFFQGVSPQFRFFLYGRVGRLMERNVFLIGSFQIVEPLLCQDGRGVLVMIALEQKHGNIQFLHALIKTKCDDIGPDFVNVVVGTLVIAVKVRNQAVLTACEERSQYRIEDGFLLLPASASELGHIYRAGPEARRSRLRKDP